MTPSIPEQSSSVALTTLSGLAVAQMMWHTSWTILTALSTLMGKQSLRKMYRVCPQATLRQFFSARSMRAWSVPDERTRQGPLASLNASPNLIPGIAVISVSCTSSTVLMKWDWAMMTLSSSGFSITTVSMVTAM